MHIRAHVQDIEYLGRSVAYELCEMAVRELADEHGGLHSVIQDDEVPDVGTMGREGRDRIGWLPNDDGPVGEALKQLRNENAANGHYDGSGIATG